MVTIPCENITGRMDTTKHILLFGLVRPVRPLRPDTREKLTARGYFLQCMAEDQNGATYEIWSDYDAALQISAAVAIEVKEATT